MQVSNDFLIRTLGKLVIQPPMLKSELDDILFINCTSKIGPHQQFLDVSRCGNLTPDVFQVLEKCVSLRYLDVSYTQICNFSPIINQCTALRSLCLAGLKSFRPEEYQSLASLNSLEFLTLRSSNIENVKMCSDMIMLRSLDLGETNISTISPLGGQRLTRLEELALDRCMKIREDAAAEEIGHLRGMSSLRILNVCETPLEQPQWRQKLLDSLPGYDSCIENKSRRELFLEAIMENDELAVRTYIGNGQDISIRLGPWAEKVLTDAWRSRCRSNKIQAPFFSIHHEKELLRPSPTHLACYFGANETLRTLLLSGGDIYEHVGFYDMKDTKDGLVVDQTLSEQRDRTEFILKDLPKVLYDRNVHRLTDGMIAKKYTNWKSRCLDIQKALEATIHNPRVVHHVASDTPPTRPNSKATARDNPPNPNGSLGENGDLSNTSNGDEVTSVAPEGSIAQSVDGSQRSQSTGGGSKVGGENEEANKGGGDSGSAAAASNTSMDILPPPDNAPNTDDEKSTTTSTSNVSTKKKKNRFPIFPKQERHDWREHSMVRKLEGKPLAVKSQNITSGREDVTVLGKKSYWNESFGHTIRAKYAEEDAAFYQAYRAKVAEKKRDGTFGKKIGRELERREKRGLYAKAPASEKKKKDGEGKDSDTSEVEKSDGDGDAVAEKEEKEEEEGEEDLDTIKDMYNEIVRKNKKGMGAYGKVKKFPGAYRGVKAESHERRQDLLALVREKVADKYKIRDDVEPDENDKGEDTDSDEST